MTILRQIKELKSEFATIHSHVLRRVVQIHGAIPVVLDPKKPLRRTLVPGWLIIGVYHPRHHMNRTMSTGRRSNSPTCQKMPLPEPLVRASLSVSVRVRDYPRGEAFQSLGAEGPSAPTVARPDGYPVRGGRGGS
jgi:hypothetical protein